MSTRENVREAYERLGGNKSAVSRELGIARSTVDYHVNNLGIGGKPLVDGSVEGLQQETVPHPPKGKTYRFILTSAQNNTKLHEPAWNNLLALADHYNARVYVGTYTYNKAAYGKLSVKRGTGKDRTTEPDLWYDERLVPHIVDGRVELAPGLVWCGEMNILPTAKRPLSGFEHYTGRKSGIFPHAKFAMDSIASAPDQPTKFNYTTGTVTQKNYLQKRAGLAAEHAHCYGGLLVEVDDKGRWFVRQLGADTKGRVYDLDLLADNGKVHKGQRVEAVTWGDIHSLMLDDDVVNLGWGKRGMVSTLRPRYQFLHDLLLGTVTNHHVWGNPHAQYDFYQRGWDSLDYELRHAAMFLKLADRDGCQTVVPWSNHDAPWIEKWLQEADYRKDPKNAELFLELQLRMYQAIRNGERDFNVLQYALGNRAAPDGVRFLNADESFTVCRGQIECGMHGHLGPNGARGTPLGLSRMGRKANTAHTHSAGILDGLYVAGSSTVRDMGYNHGPSSWSHSHVVTYPNGKRSIVTMWDGRWRA